MMDGDLGADDGIDSCKRMDVLVGSEIGSGIDSGIGFEMGFEMGSEMGSEMGCLGDDFC